MPDRPPPAPPALSDVALRETLDLLGQVVASMSASALRPSAASSRSRAVPSLPASASADAISAERVEKASTAARGTPAISNAPLIGFIAGLVA